MHWQLIVDLLQDAAILALSFAVIHLAKRGAA